MELRCYQLPCSEASERLTDMVIDLSPSDDLQARSHTFLTPVVGNSSTYIKSNQYGDDGVLPFVYI